MAAKKKLKIVTAEDRYIKALGEEKVKSSIPYFFTFSSWTEQTAFHFSLIGNCKYILYDGVDNSSTILFYDEDNVAFAVKKCEELGGEWKKVNLRQITKLET